MIEYKFLRDKEKLSDKLQTAVTQIVTKEGLSFILLIGDQLAFAKR